MWWSSIGSEFFFMITILYERMRIFISITWNWSSYKTRWSIWRRQISWIWTVSWIMAITWKLVYKISWRLFNWMNLTLFSFKVLLKCFDRWFQSRMGILFSFFIFAFFAKRSKNRVTGFMKKVTVFPKFMFTLINQIKCLCKLDFRIRFIRFSEQTLRFLFWVYIIDFQW